MKKYCFFPFVLLMLVCVGTSCKKFLEVEPVDRLSDNSFWKTKSDVESAVADTYGAIFDLITDGPYHFAAGEMRAGEFITVSNFPCFPAVGHNQLNNTTKMGDPARYKMLNLSDWYPFYQSIASCNIDLQRIPEVTTLSSEEKKRYLAEVRFVRAFTYFYIGRIYGDVPLYTEAYDVRPLPRTPMLEVMKYCLSELDAIKDDLPWQYDDPSKWGVRAAKGAVYALIANINMWMAGFDKGGQTTYWKNTADAVQAIISSKQFGLLPVENFKTLFKGRTKESLFEFEVNANYGSQTKYVTVGQWTQHSPLVVYSSSDCYYDADFMKRLYPEAQPDRRRDLWFYLPYINNNTFMMLKFSNVVDPVNFYYDDNLVIFRYGGILLLGAEALADLNRNAEAVALLNQIRQRAGAKLYESSDGDLGEFIFWEEQRELIGEGFRWYDLVRTGRVENAAECKDWLTPEQFKRGAWTWPIDPKARVNNPNIVLNSYWVK